MGGVTSAPDPSDRRPLSSRPQRIGMLGGTFDPPHNAHLALAEAARVTLDLDRVVFVPAGDPWRKRDRVITPAAARVEMVRAATAHFPWASVSTVEVDRAGPSYTAETLEALVEPGDEWWFILGADALADMPHWSEPQRILKCARLAVARRPDSEGPLLTGEVRRAMPGIEGRIDFLVMPQLDISATEIRRRVASGESTDELLPHAVREVMERHGLYR